MNDARQVIRSSMPMRRLLTGLATALLALLFSSPSAAAAAPPQRAYEMVTPVDKNGGNAESTDVLDSDHVVLSGTASFLDSDPAFGITSKYLASRSGAGWTLSSGVLAAGVSIGDPGTEVQDVSDDLSRQIVVGRSPLVAADGDAQQFDVYVRTGAGLRLASTGSLGGDEPTEAVYAGRSADAGHVLFETAERL